MRKPWRVVDVLKHLPEKMRFVRWLRSFAGFRQVGLAYERATREGGKPKYTFGSLIVLAIDGLINFSSYSLRLVTYLGLVTICIALALLVWVVSSALYNQRARSQKAVGPGTSGSRKRPDFPGNLIVLRCTPDVDLTNRT